MGKWLKKIASRRVAKPNSFLARLRRDSRGNTLAMAGAALVPIAGMIGSGLDMSRAYMAQAKLQNACDAAALGARREMSGAVFDADVRAEGERFFDFNFPSTTMNAQNVTRTIVQSTTDSSTVEVTASADIPTSVMGLFGKDFIPISVECEANQDYGNNDIMVVLDVTGSMNCPPGTGGSCGNVEQTGSKASRLRSGASGLYRALAGATNTRTRYGLMPYSVTVNVGADLDWSWIRNSHYYYDNTGGGWYQLTENIDDTVWADSSVQLGIENWQASSNTCIEERIDVDLTPDTDNGVWATVEVDTTVSQADIDTVASSSSDYRRQWGRYRVTRPDGSTANGSPRCPSPASRLQEYATEADFNSAINSATVNLGGNTYHDIGIIWAVRYLSSTGMFASHNPEMHNGIPVAKHIVYMTDGILVPNSSVYTAYGRDNNEDRVSGPGGEFEEHRGRFWAACDRGKSMGMTIWVIALGVTDTSDIEPCATSSGHFFTSDGSDLEQVFERIGAGIGRLRLTQ